MADGNADGTGLSDGGVIDSVDGAGLDPKSPGAWVLSYFGTSQELAADSLHLAYSLDGLHWSGLAYGQPAYQLEGIGTGHIRDPFLFRKNDRTFVYIATDWTLANNDDQYWNHPSPAIVVADTTDLITFTNPRRLMLTNLPGPMATPMHAWAPEAYYDADRHAYAIVWSGNDANNRNRTYVSYTQDFATVLSSTPDVLFDPGYSSIDATIERSNGRNYLFFKDETDNSDSPLTGSGKDIQIARSPATALNPGSFDRWSPMYITRGANQSARQVTEAPFALFSAERNLWFLFAQFYVDGGFGAWSSRSLDAAPNTWTALASSDFRFPEGVSHAHALRVTKAELDLLIAHYGISHRLRTTYREGGVPFYVANSWFHGMITPESDRSNNQLANDFLWKIVPGLADPSDPSLVSLESVEHPGQYLRIDSQNPGRYPPCSEASNRGESLCAVPASDRHHLTSVDPAVNSAGVPKRRLVPPHARAQRRRIHDLAAMVWGFEPLSPARLVPTVRDAHCGQRPIQRRVVR